MNKIWIFFNLLVFSYVHSQDTIVHTIDINPSSKMAVEVLEIITNHEYLFKIDKDKEVDDLLLIVSPSNYKRIKGKTYDYLLFDSSNVKITMVAQLPDSFFVISNDGTQTISLDFHYNFLDIDNLVEIDSTTSTFVSSIVHINDDYRIVDYKLNPDIQRKRIDGNIIRFKGEVNIMHVEVGFVQREVSTKRIIVQKELQIKGDLTLNIWDEMREDGDIINLWIGKFCLAENLKVSKKKIQYKITKEMFGNSDTLTIRIENVDEGKVPPNTVIAELKGKGVYENMRINTTPNMSKVIILTK